MSNAVDDPLAALRERQARHPRHNRGQWLLDQFARDSSDEHLLEILRNAHLHKEHHISAARKEVERRGLKP